MKKQGISFTLGVIATLLAISLTVPALAAAGITISVNTDMKIQVNGEVFQPKNVNGEDVLVFEYEGTTYAPVRAIAEAYGLEVGYDQNTRMATVKEKSSIINPTSPIIPETTPSPSLPISEIDGEEYETFKAMWELTSTKSISIHPLGETICYYFKPASKYNAISEQEFHSELKKIGDTKINTYIRKWLLDCNDGEHSIYFTISSYGYSHGEIRYNQKDGQFIGAFRIHHDNCGCEN